MLKKAYTIKTLHLDPNADIVKFIEFETVITNPDYPGVHSLHSGIVSAPPGVPASATHAQLVTAIETALGNNKAAVEAYATEEIIFQSQLKTSRTVALVKVFPTLTPRQFWLAAANIGITKDQVMAAIDQNLPASEAVAAKIELTETINFDRSHPSVTRLAALMSIPASQLDDLWIWAAAL